MGVQNPNSTDYVHPDEPNLLNLHKAMQYNDLGEPEIRAHIHGITLEGNVIVTTIDSSIISDGVDVIFSNWNHDAQVLNQVFSANRAKKNSK